MASGEIVSGEAASVELASGELTSGEAAESGVAECCLVQMICRNPLQSEIDVFYSRNI